MCSLAIPVALHRDRIKRMQASPKSADRLGVSCCIGPDLTFACAFCLREHQEQKNELLQ